MTTTDEPPVLITGGGIGGVAAALACARAGVPVRLLERAPELRELGAGLQLGPNAARVLRDLGVFDLAAQSAVLPRRAVLVNADTGEEVASLWFDADFRARYGAPYTVMHRGDLLTALLDGCAATGLVDIRTGKEVTGFEQDSRRVTVRCADGTEFTATALIGADGINSTIRKQVIGPDAPLASAYAIYRGPGPRPDGVEDAVILYAGDGYHLMQYPMHGQEMLNRVASFRTPGLRPGDPGWGTLEELGRAFAPACDAVREGLTHLDTSKCWELYDRAPAAGWTDGRVTLLGDAAHAMRQYLAQGAGQALEDALCVGQHLARALADDGPDGVPAALKAYESVRYPRTTAVQGWTRYFGELVHMGGVAATLRDTIFRGLPPGAEPHLSWLYAPAPPPPPPVPSGLPLYSPSFA
jgi:3-hydroxybenzoate 6-monooxygenase